MMALQGKSGWDNGTLISKGKNQHASKFFFLIPKASLELIKPKKILSKDIAFWPWDINNQLLSNVLHIIIPAFLRILHNFPRFFYIKYCTCWPQAYSSLGSFKGPENGHYGYDHVAHPGETFGGLTEFRSSLASRWRRHPWVKTSFCSSLSSRLFWWSWWYILVIEHTNTTMEL